MMNTITLFSFKNISDADPIRIIVTAMIINHRLVSHPGLSIMPAIIGWHRAEVIFATARRIPTSVLVNPFAKR